MDKWGNGIVLFGWFFFEGASNPSMKQTFGDVECGQMVVWEGVDNDLWFSTLRILNPKSAPPKCFDRVQWWTYTGLYNVIIPNMYITFRLICTLEQVAIRELI